VALLQVAQDSTDPSLRNSSAVLSTLKTHLIESITDGRLGAALGSEASSQGSAIMADASVRVDASVAFVDATSRVIRQYLLHRYPTSSPSLSPMPSRNPSKAPEESSNDKRKESTQPGTNGWGNPNPWLVVVITVEVVISVALCVSCIKAGRRRTGDHDPLALAELAAQQRRNLLTGMLDPVTLSHQRLRAQYARAVECLPTVKFRDHQLSPRGEGGGGDGGEGGDDATAPSSSVSGDSGNVASHSDERMSGVYMEDSCSICLTTYVEGDDELVKVLNCGHAFHPPCLDEWLMRRNVCPLCKRVAVSDLDPARNNAQNPTLAATRQRPPPEEGGVGQGEFPPPDVHSGSCACCWPLTQCVGSLGRFVFARSRTASVAVVATRPDGDRVVEPQARNSARNSTRNSTANNTAHFAPVTPSAASAAGGGGGRDGGALPAEAPGGFLAQGLEVEMRQLSPRTHSRRWEQDEESSGNARLPSRGAFPSLVNQPSNSPHHSQVQSKSEKGQRFARRAGVPALTQGDGAAAVETEQEQEKERAGNAQGGPMAGASDQEQEEGAEERKN